MMRWKKQGRTRHEKEDTDANRRDIDRPVFRGFAALGPRRRARPPQVLDLSTLLTYTLMLKRSCRTM